MSRYLYPFLQTLWKNQFSPATLILITSLHLLFELLQIQLPKARQKRKTCYLISRQQWRLQWAASLRKSPNVTIDGKNWEDLTWIKMIVRTKIAPLLSSYRSKRINYLNCSSSWNDIAMYYLCLVSKVQNMIWILSSTHSCQRTRHWTHCHQESEPVHLAQFWWYSAIG